jgi:linoleoyl-CoA desaturase
LQPKIHTLSKVRFTGRQTPFFDDLKKEVDSYFQSAKTAKTGDFRLYLKTFIIMTGLLSSYIVLVFFTPSAIPAILISAFFGFTLALVGMNVMHDACHGAFSSNPKMNNIIGYSMNFLGSNQFIWKIKHNRIHHTYTNVDGVDDDIIKVPILRHCESQPWKKVHKFQHVYMVLLYGLSTILWVLVTDTQKYLKKDISGTPIEHIPVKEHVIFWVTKLLYILFYIAIPIYFVGFSKFIVGYLIANFVFGLVLSIVFQLAHAVEATHFENARGKDLTVDTEWAVHQVVTTADFAPKSPLANWICGGLNFQVVHHLFPNVSHVHYRSIQPIVERVCKKHNVHYNLYNTFGEAVASHFNYMRVLGEKE